MLSGISKKLQDGLKSQFKTLGFKKKGGSWSHVNGELAKWFNIQCSRNSDNIYINVGIYFQAVKEVDFPKETDCHLRFRLEQLLGSDDEIRRFYELSNFESGLDCEAKIEKLANIITDKLVPFFVQHNSVADILNSQQVKSYMYWNNGKDIANRLCN